MGSFTQEVITFVTRIVYRTEHVELSCWFRWNL